MLVPRRNRHIVTCNSSDSYSPVAVNLSIDDSNYTATMNDTSLELPPDSCPCSGCIVRFFASNYFGTGAESLAIGKYVATYIVIGVPFILATPWNQRKWPD